MNLPFRTLLLCLLLAGCEGCQDDPEPKTELEKLPRATQEGKNTFGCLVNGKAWVTRTSVDAYAFYQEGVLSITARVVNETFYQNIRITVIDVNLSEKEIQLSDPPHHLARVSDLGEKCYYVTSSDHTGRLTITRLDRREWIISGTFEFEAYSSDCDEIINVTDGRFDLTYAP